MLHICSSEQPAPYRGICNIYIDIYIQILHTVLHVSCMEQVLTSRFELGDFDPKASVP
eukprot:COSAG03_NODE_23594_length_278_cov_12.720670_1_plen_57_part_10